MQLHESKRRLLYPIKESRELLGGIGNSLFYELVKTGQIKLTKIGKRSFVSHAELKRAAAIFSDATVAAYDGRGKASAA